MKQKLLPLLGLAFAFLLPSCLEVETEITLNKDGSGTITEELMMGAQMVGMIEMAAAQGGGADNPLADMKDEEKAKAKAKTYGEGVTFVKAEEIKGKDGGKGVRVTYKFTDINKLSINPVSGMSDIGPMKDAHSAVEKVEDAKATFKYADGKLTIILPQPDAAEGEGENKGGEDAPDANDPQAAMAAQMMKGMKMTAKLTIADGIADTNATYHEGNTITLLEMEMDKVLQNPGGMAAIQGIDKKGPEAMAEALKKVKGIKFETKKEVNVTIK